MHNQKRSITNLFDKNDPLTYLNARIGAEGETYLWDYYASISFVSNRIYVESGKKYMLVRKPVSETTIAYNRWAFYDAKMSIIKADSSFTEKNIIQIPDGCAIVRFTGLITDIDNAKFYEL